MARCYKNFWVSARTLPCSIIPPALGSWEQTQSFTYTSWWPHRWFHCCLSPWFLCWPVGTQPWGCSRSSWLLMPSWTKEMVFREESGSLSHLSGHLCFI